jgi:hypothetical protein
MLDGYILIVASNNNVHRKETTMAKEKNTPRPDSVRNLICNVYSESEDDASFGLCGLTNHANPKADKEGSGGMGTFYQVNPSIWTQKWVVTPNKGMSVPADDSKYGFKRFVHCLLTWPKYNNPAQGVWTYISAEFSIYTRNSLSISNEDKVSLEFDDKGFLKNESDLNKVYELYRKKQEESPNQVACDIVCRISHNGKGNPNGDPHSNNEPRVNDSTGKMWMSRFCMHNKIREVLREENEELLIQSGESLETKESELLNQGVFSTSDYRYRYVDTFWFGGIRAVKGAKKSSKKDDTESED